jgi:hypothetical protein
VVGVAGRVRTKQVPLPKCVHCILQQENGVLVARHTNGRVASPNAGYFGRMLFVSAGNFGNNRTYPEVRLQVGAGRA